MLRGAPSFINVRFAGERCCSTDVCVIDEGNHVPASLHR